MGLLRLVPAILLADSSSPFGQAGANVPLVQVDLQPAPNQQRIQHGLPGPAVPVLVRTGLLETDQESLTVVFQPLSFKIQPLTITHNQRGEGGPDA